MSVSPQLKPIPHLIQPTIGEHHHRIEVALESDGQLRQVAVAEFPFVLSGENKQDLHLAVS
jgi:hypothetical protein